MSARCCSAGSCTILPGRGSESTGIVKEAKCRWCGAAGGFQARLVQVANKTIFGVRSKRDYMVGSTSFSAVRVFFQFVGNVGFLRACSILSEYISVVNRFVVLEQKLQGTEIRLCVPCPRGWFVFGGLFTSATRRKAGSGATAEDRCCLAHCVAVAVSLFCASVTQSSRRPTNTRRGRWLNFLLLVFALTRCLMRLAGENMHRGAALTISLLPLLFISLQYELLPVPRPMVKHSPLVDQKREAGRRTQC